MAITQGIYWMSLTSAYRRAEDVRIGAVVVAEQKLRDVERHMFSAHVMEFAKQSDDSAFNVEYRPKRRPRRYRRPIMRAAVPAY